jgi:hypothetical protein
MRRLRPVVMLLALATAAMLAPVAAHAQWHRGGVFFGFAPPIVVGPPVYYAPPPVYYAPPPAYYAAPGYPPPGYPPAGYPPAGYPPTASEAGASCYAGAYVCPLERPGPPNTQCSCPTRDGRQILGHIGS